MRRLPPRIRELAQQWLIRPLTEAEYQEFEAWYGEPVPEAILWDTGDQSEAEVRNRILANVLRKVQKPAAPARPLPAPRYRRRAWLVAAAMVLLLALGVGLLPYWTRQRAAGPASLATVRSGAGQIRKVVLPDSSLVWLKGRSELRYPRSFTAHERNVVLTGEALFEVTKNPQRPFQVRVGRYTTQVLGTSFNIRQKADGQDFDLVVLTGRVRVLADGLLGKKPVRDVVANQTFTTVRPPDATDSPAPVRPLAPRAVAQATAGTDYDMSFAQVPFGEIMARIEQKFGVRFVDYANQYDGCKVTADLTDQSLEKSLQLLTSAISATYVVRGNTIKLTGGGCF